MSVWLHLGWPIGSQASNVAQAQTTTVLQAPLSTRKSEILDAQGRTVLLRGVNWFGLETETHAPHGLWERDYVDVITQIKQMGYNVIRLPYSLASLKSQTFSSVNFDLPGNATLRHKTPLQVMDAVVQEAGRQGLFIVLDSHRLNDQRIPELWYGDGFTEADWINTWTMLAERYKNQPNVIGADLKNEPHGKASWGTGDRATDWRLAAERAGNAILKVNRNWLIIVEGVENNVPGQKLKHWMGGNLEGVDRFPVRLSVPNRVVYSPHEYGPGVFAQPWFAEKSFPKNLVPRWNQGFYYIAQRGIAPIWVGEFGGRETDNRSKEGIWQQQLVQFLQKNRLGFAYWSLNPNSGDTGGLLLDDWKTIDLNKQKLLSSLLPTLTMQPVGNNPPVMPAPASPTPIPSSQLVPLPTPSPRNHPRNTPNLPATPPSTGAQLQVQVQKQSDWETGFCIGIQVSNPTQQSISNWALRFTMTDAAINQSWNGSFMAQGLGNYQVQPADWGKTLAARQTMDLGFCADKKGSNSQPRDFRVIQP
ncbi:cellulase family glycosylhydrolase [Alkalinema pantanalense CENA528]|uniref:cellulase family glycosylhydrolase n=1 Tax=Alkalinema pantanalense TaxID=1620705 RepID=UPI003D6ECD72